MEEKTEQGYRYSLKLYRLKERRRQIDKRIAQITTAASDEDIIIDEPADEMAYYTKKVAYKTEKNKESETEPETPK